jgi:hypothetical protein
MRDYEQLTMDELALYKAKNEDYVILDFVMV